MSEIRVVATDDGSGICVKCGNGLWKKEPPCNHKLDRQRAREIAAAVLASPTREDNDAR